MKKKKLSNNHKAFTFEMNNKGQLKREFPPGHGRKENNIEGEDGSDHDTDNKGELVGAGAESMCQPGKHKWKHDQCMVCSVCGECTGYEAGCVSASRQNRNPGMLYGCGSGDSGCLECGVCRVCAGKVKMKLRVQDKMEQGLFQ